jgi:hypothetical protein
MSHLSKRGLFWAPRILAMVFVAFLSLFALDVFDEHLGVWRTMLALTIHLIPSFVLILALILAWRWEWIGAAIFGGAGLLYIVWLMSMPRHLPTAVRLNWALCIAGPALLVAALFLVNWLKRSELRTL